MRDRDLVERRLEEENSSLFDRQMDAVTAHRDKMLTELQGRLEFADRSGDSNLRRTIPLRTAELRRAEDRFEHKLASLKKGKSALSEHHEIAAGFIVVA
jgi:hypothetical protein